MGAVGGRNYDIYSAATTSGTANVNPLTNLAVASALAVDDPSFVYNNPSLYPITEANLNQAVLDIQSMLKPLLDAYNANINPITGAYTADHTGLDLLLDAVKVSINTANGNVVITDLDDNTLVSGSTDDLSNSHSD